MKYLYFVIVMIVMSHRALSQEIPASGLRLIARIIIPSLEAETYTVLTEKQIGTYLSNALRPHPDEVAVYKSGSIWGIAKSSVSGQGNSPIQLTKEQIKEMSKMLNILNGHTDPDFTASLRIPTKAPLWTNSKYIDVKKIQAALNILGYQTKQGTRLKEDGILGLDTKAGIEALFGINCESLSEVQIIEKINALRSSQKPTNPVRYDLVVINKKTTEKTEMKDLSAQALGEQLQKFSCSLGEVCAHINTNTGSVQFECKADENSLSVNISTKGSMEIGLKTNDNLSTRFSIDKDGKIKLSASDGKYTREITSEPK